MESSFPIESFKHGIDTRRSVLSSQVGTLLTCENGFVNSGGEVEKRKKFDAPSYNVDVFDDQHRSISITSVGTLATATLASHGLTTGEYVQISGAVESGYNGIFAVTVLTGSTFTYVMDADPSSPATGTPVLDHVGTYGIESTDAGLVVFGSALVFGTTPTQSQPVLASALTTVVYQQLKHPSLTNDSTETYNAFYHRMVAVVFSDNYNGKAFACAQFADGRRFLYYDGELVQQSTNGVVMEGRTALADLGNDLTRQVEEVGWAAQANRTEVVLDSLTRVTTTATATYTNHGLTTGDFVEIAGAQVSSSIDNAYNGRFAVTVTSSSTFTYVMASDPGASATAGTARATIYQAGSVLLKSAPNETFSATAEETSSSGQIGVKLDGTLDYPYTGSGVGHPGKSAVAFFIITVNTGPFTLTAPENSDGTGTADLCGGSVSASFSTSTTAAAIVKAVNDLTFVHGYFASQDSATPSKVYIFAPLEWGPVTFNLTVIGDTTTTTTDGGALTASIDPPEATLVFRTPSNGLSSVVLTNGGAGYSCSARGGTAPYFFAWSAATPGSNNGFLVSPQATTFNQSRVWFTLLPEGVGQQFLVPVPIIRSGTFKCRVTDAAGGEVILIITVSINISH